MKISLIVPAYNEEKYIGNCLSSIEKYGKDLFEVIVINNASTDNTSKVVENFPNVRLINETKKGLPFARNRGLSEAKGDIVAFVDADTMIKKGWVDRIKKEFEKDEKLAYISGPYVYYDFSLILKLLTWFVYIFIAYPSYIFVGYMATMGNFAARKSFMNNVGGFDNTIIFHGDDTDISRKLHGIGKTKFSLSFYLPSSARRLKGEGYIITVYQYIVNFLCIVFIKRPQKNADYIEIR